MSAPTPLPAMPDGGRVFLRPVTLEDEGFLFSLFSNPEVVRYWFEPAWTDSASARRRAEGSSAANASGDGLSCLIVRKADGHTMGTCDLHNWHKGSRRAEVGYSLHPEFWGNGYAAEAVELLAAHCFDVLKLNRLEADIDPLNTASARVLERLGFRLEGILPERWIVNGVKSDTAIYGLLESTWSTRKGGPI